MTRRGAPSFPAVGGRVSTDPARFAFIGADGVGAVDGADGADGGSAGHCNTIAH